MYQASARNRCDLFVFILSFPRHKQFFYYKFHRIIHLRLFWSWYSLYLLAALIFPVLIIILLDLSASDFTAPSENHMWIRQDWKDVDIPTQTENRDNFLSPSQTHSTRVRTSVLWLQTAFAWNASHENDKLNISRQLYRSTPTAYVSFELCSLWYYYTYIVTA